MDMGVRSGALRDTHKISRRSSPIEEGEEPERRPKIGMRRNIQGQGCLRSERSAEWNEPREAFNSVCSVSPFFASHRTKKGRRNTQSNRKRRTNIRALGAWMHGFGHMP